MPIETDLVLTQQVISRRAAIQASVAGALGIGMNHRTAQPVSAAAYKAFSSPADAANSTHPFDARPQPWQRGKHPALSALTTKQSWCKVVLYSPSVLHHDGRFKMWYVGTSTASRATDFALGYAESKDGIHWKEHPGNPIATAKDIGWGIYFQTPFVLFDENVQLYKMWFSSATKRVPHPRVSSLFVGADRPLGYATSRDGIRWDFHPQPILEPSRSPCVFQLAPNKYRMWMNTDLRRIYEFTSSDGLDWKRARTPAISPSGDSRTCVYPFVLKEADTYYMWYGCHRPKGVFELFCATSPDGSRWKINHQNAAFPASRQKDRFDGRYTSIPFVLSLPDRYLMYYAARDLNDLYKLPDGSQGRDGSGVYSHIGVASIPKS